VLRRGNPYICLAAAIVLLIVAVAVDSEALRVLLGVLGVTAAAAAVLQFVRQGRDPNGPPGQH